MKVNEQNNVNTTKTKNKRKEPPNILVILFCMMIITAVTTYFVPAGEYERTTNDEGREILVNGTYQQTEGNPTGFLEFFNSLYDGMSQASGIIFLLLITGGVFGILGKTGAIESALHQVIKKMHGKEVYLIPVLFAIFSLAGASFGLGSEAMVYIIILLPLLLRAGFDSIIAVAVPMVGVAIGYAGGFLNPYNVGVAHGIAELPLFSGMGVRIICWLILLIVSGTYITLYARKIQKNPEKSLVYDEDHNKKVKENKEVIETRLTGKHILILICLAATFISLPIGIINYGWYFKEITGLFLLMGVVVGMISRMNVNQVASSFTDGCKNLMEGALAVGFAYTIVVILQNSNLIDTIVYGLTNLAGQFPSSFAAFGMFLGQFLLNLPVNSGSGQAALSMPIMTPIADLVGVSRQTAVLAFQFGDGFTNAFYPTNGGLMAGIAIAGISWLKWARFMLPLVILLFITCAIMVTLVHLFVWPA
ncbi:YfcC family protein [Oceanobacillus damuensis]|uniref:YfcC family protein n=1 Tax=Oceanobacillus damuensis TaxID=937928 RepID=UPI000836E991|nr:Na+/H+ antiporter NhaC family protein [Oceanobacillus damuensis]